jgi:hypothetical protein
MRLCDLAQILPAWIVVRVIAAVQTRREPPSMSHFLDRLTFFKKQVDTFSDGHGIVTNEPRAWEDGYRKRSGSTTKSSAPPTG